MEAATRRLALTLMAALALTGCMRGAHRPPCPPGALCLLYGNGAEPISLDPAKVDGVWEQTIVSQLLVGLADRDGSGHPIPAMAKSWDVTPDGLTWTFHLRDAVWSDGAPVTAEDFAYAMRRVEDPKTASYSAFLLFPMVLNAEQVNAGDLPTSALGVEAVDPHTLVIHLSHPWPNLSQLMTTRVMWPVPSHLVKQVGDAWAKPGSYLSNGPYTLVSWRLGDRVVLKKNPLYWAADKVCYTEIAFYPSSDAIANERAVAAGELDVSTTVQSNRIAHLRQTSLASSLRVAPEWGVTYLAFNLKDPSLADVRVRQALSMAIDREFITGKLLRGMQTPAYSLVPTGIPGYQPGPQTYWAAWPLARRQAEARRLLAAAGYGPGHPLSLLIKHRNSADPLLFMPSIQNDWRLVGVNVQLQQNDVQVAYQEYEIHDFQVGDAGWLAEDPMDYLDLARSDTGGQNYGDYNNPAYDAALDAALAQPDPAKRADDEHQAEAILLRDAVIAPIYFVSSRNLVDPVITGWVDNPIDTHRTRLLCQLPRSPGGAAAAS
ncbi:MAG TPA: peptide ABC transporter substrate-binding protein [Caulobacteraceae bacterium]